MQVYWSVFVDTCRYHAWLIRYDTVWFFGPFEVNFKWNGWNIAVAALLILFLFRKERRKWTVLMTRKVINISTYSKVLRRIESLEKNLPQHGKWPFSDGPVSLVTLPAVGYTGKNRNISGSLIGMFLWVTGRIPHRFRSPIDLLLMYPARTMLVFHHPVVAF